MKKIIEILYNFLTKRVQKKEVKEKTLFNKDGKEVFKKYTMISTSLHKMDYDEDGNEIATKSMYDGHINRMTKKEKLDNGEIKETAYNFDNNTYKFEKKFIRYYDDDYNVYDENHNLVIENITEFDDKGQLVKDIRKYNEKHIQRVETHEYVYDERGNQIKECGKTVDSDGSIIYRSGASYTYDKNDRVIVRTNSFKAMTEDSMLDNDDYYKFEYDDQGREIHCWHQDHDRIRNRTNIDIRDNFYFGDDYIEVSNHITLGFMITTYIKTEIRPDGTKLVKEWYLPNWFGKLLVKYGRN